MRQTRRDLLAALPSAARIDTRRRSIRSAREARARAAVMRWVRSTPMQRLVNVFDADLEALTPSLESEGWLHLNEKMPDWITMMPPVKNAVSSTIGTERTAILCRLRRSSRPPMRGGKNAAATRQHHPANW